ncbi:MAG TPA: TonB-dependent receptor [Bacteroidia bacterium]|jgi:outer membrane receptor protein involved in Fe transport|nr:TonB-dependent receptor [Bacteroidia bacterium]
MKPTDSYLVIVIIFLFPFCSFGQGLQGKIVDSVTNRPVEYAVISIYQTTSASPLSGKLTDSTGRFTFDKLPFGVYDLKVEFMGYRTKQLKGITLTTAQTLNLGEIKFLSSSTLNELVVSAEQNAFVSKIDKQIYKADKFETAKGGTGIDVIKNMPAVSVNAENEIRLRGSTGFLLLINGKPVLTDATTVLSQLPANSIENIEIITAPSAKYDADGKAGIINITTKKGTDDGLLYTVGVQYGLPAVNSFHNLKEPQRYGVDATFNYKKNKWDISAGGSYQENDLAGRRVGDAHTTIENRYSSFPSVGERSFQKRNYALRTLISFKPDNYNTFGVSLYTGQRQQYRRADIYYNNTKTDIFTNQSLGSIYYFNSNLQKKQGDFSLISAEYAHTFKNKSVLSMSGLYEYALLSGFTKNLNTSSLERDDTLSYVLNTANSPLSGLRLKTDYTISIGKGKLESGYQLRHQYQTGTFLYENAILGTPYYNVVPAFSADIVVINDIHSLYTQLSNSIGKLDYTGGIRYEYAQRSFHVQTEEEIYKLNRSNFFPSVNMLYRLKENTKLKAGYSKRIQRSTSNELNPYPEREHSETLEQGDPHILPEMVDVSELGLINDFKKGNFFITLYNQQIQHVVNRVNSVYNDTILNRIYTNAGNAQLWGFEGGFTYSPVKWWNSYIGGNVYDYKIKGSLFDNAVTVKNGGIAYSINTTQTFQIYKTWNVQLALNYLSLRPTAIGEDSRFISPNISIKKEFLKGALTATLLWQNVSLGHIPSNEQRITAYGSDFYTTTNYIQEKDVFWINLSYQLKQRNKKIKLPASEFGEREF